ncbi:MAG: hypothetical protein IID15_04980 [Candidatus Marinimicrobia bacterium]|nr:hypothetical protein [Candidatus Neomarinimicrobiota bacterium]
MLIALSLLIYAWVAWVLLRQAGGFIVTPALLFFLFFTVFIYIVGLSYFIHNGEGTLWGTGRRNYPFYLALNGGMLCLALGAMLTSGLARFQPRAELRSFRLRAWVDTHNLPSDKLVLFLVAGGATLITLFFVFVLRGGSIPLLTVLTAADQGNVRDLASAARAEFSRYGVGAGDYVYQGYVQQFYIVILPAVVLMFGGKYLLHRERLWKWAWIFFALVAAFFLVMSLQRWPLMFFLILNYLIISGFYGRVKISHAAIFSVIIFGLFGAISYIRGMPSLAGLLIGIKERIFYISAEIFYSLFEMFPKHFPFWGGEALMSDLAGVLPGPGSGFASWLFDNFYRVIGNGTAPTLFWGEMYVDFGLPGVWMGALLSGIVMQAIYIYFIRGRKSLYSLVIYAIFTVSMAQLANTNPVEVLFKFGMVTVLLLLLMMNTLRWLLYTTPFPPAPQPLVERAVT